MTLMYQAIASCIVASFGLLLFYQAYTHSKKGSFFSDTPQWLWLGSYVWGDGLILGPFWFLSSLSWFFISQKAILLWIVLFFLARSFYEVMYWLTHQFAQKQYRPPVFRSVEWLSSEAVAILYQLFHTCVIVLCLVGIYLILSF